MNIVLKVFFLLVTLLFAVLTITSVMDQNWEALIFFVMATISSYVFYRAY